MPPVAGITVFAGETKLVSQILHPGKFNRCMPWDITILFSLLFSCFKFMPEPAGLSLKK